MMKKIKKIEKKLVNLVANDIGDTSKLTEDQIFWYNLTKQEKREITNCQWDLLHSGFGKGTDFVAKTCFEESVRLFKEKHGKN